MQGKILIVDAIATNRIVLKVKLASAYYQVLQASDMAEAMTMAQAEAPDLVICAVEMPDGNAAALCAAMRAEPVSKHIPIMAIGARPDATARMATLEAGAQDVMIKPIDDTLLLGRVRSLIRAYNATADWRMRDDTSEALGMAEPATEFAPNCHCQLVTANTGQAQHWMLQLRGRLRAKLSLSSFADVLRDVQGRTTPDIFVLILPPEPAEAAATIRLIPALRANGATRHAGVLVLQTSPDAQLAANALDLGADDLMSDGFEAAELILRLDSLVRTKRQEAHLRATYRTGLKAAVHDPLTGLHNRRYAMPHLDRLAVHAGDAGQSCAVMVADLDHFKQINDVYGHASGDAVLVEVARRLRGAMRSTDMVARIGGEEFMIVMPGTSPEEARAAAVRICNDIGATPFVVPGRKRPISVTISIGMAIGGGTPCDTTREGAAGARLLDQADKALYSAKMRGRNRVTLSRPAA